MQTWGTGSNHYKSSVFQSVLENIYEIIISCLEMLSVMGFYFSVLFVSPSE